MIRIVRNKRMEFAAATILEEPSLGMNPLAVLVSPCGTSFAAISYMDSRGGTGADTD
jgi:hypothetical protein